MSHFVGIVFSSNHEEVEDLLSPYDENLEVDEYIMFTASELMEKAVNYAADLRKYIEEHFDSPNSYEHKRAEELRITLEKDYNNFESKDDYLTWINRHYDLDSKGNALSTYNPDSKWDWWEVGGRWSGEILHAGSYDTNQAPKEALTKIDTPYCFVDLEGNWHEIGTMGWWGMSINEKEKEVWEKEFRDYLNSVPEDTIITVVDFHI